MPIIEPPFGPYKKFKENGLSKNEWYQLMIPWFYYKYVDGFDMPIEEITEILQVSSKYLKIKLQPEVDCVTAHAASIVQGALGLSKNDMRPLVYYNRAQFEEWLKRHCVCTYQTELVDVTEMFPYVKQEMYHKEVIERVKNGAVSLTVKTFLQNLGIIPKIHGYPNYLKRSEVDMPRYSIDLNLDWMKLDLREGRREYPKNYESRPEPFYRRMVAEGAIKIQLNFGDSAKKAIYYVPPQKHHDHVYIGIFPNDHLIQV